MAQLINPFRNPGGVARTVGMPIHAPLPPGLMLNSKQKKKKRISLKQNGPTRYEMMLGAVGLGSSSRPKKIRSKKKKSTAAQVPTVPEGLSTRMLTSGNPVTRARGTAVGMPTSTRKIRKCIPQMYCKSGWKQGAGGAWLCDQLGSRCIWR